MIKISKVTNLLDHLTEKHPVLLTYRKKHFERFCDSQGLHSEEGNYTECRKNQCHLYCFIILKNKCMNYIKQFYFHSHNDLKVNFQSKKLCKNVQIFTADKRSVYESKRQIRHRCL